VSVAAQAAELPEDEQRRVAERARAGDSAGAKGEIKKAARKERERTLADKQRALPDKRYGVILADPPWRFEPRSRDTGMDRAADNHYPTMDSDEIAALPIKGIAAADCVLFLWATAPMLRQAIQVMEAGGRVPQPCLLGEGPGGHRVLVPQPARGVAARYAWQAGGAGAGRAGGLGDRAPGRRSFGKAGGRARAGRSDVPIGAEDRAVRATSASRL
jgi:hypothetical protein